MRHLSTRRVAAAFAAVLAAATLPLVAPPAQADAADPCTSEVQPTDPVFGLPTGAACDDTVPPATTLGAATPAVTRGWVASTAVTIAFTGAHTDAGPGGDTDPIDYQCQFFNSAIAPTRWDACTSPVSYDKLEERSATPYTFRVRAVDRPDNAHDITTDPFFAAPADLPDVDQTPAELVFRADATAPSTFGFLRTNYYDQDRQDAPMVTTPKVQIRLQSNEGGPDEVPTYRCRLDDRTVACTDGLTTLRRLAAGMHRFTAASVDPAGNVDPTPFAQQFFVPRNLTTDDATPSSSGDWRRVRSAGAFAGDYLQATAYGATLSLPVRNIRAIRLLAPAGPKLGKVDIRVGQGAWTRVDLASQDAQRLKIYQVRDELSGLLAGPLQIRVASRDRLVRVDAVMAR
ncbi:MULTISPECIES: hypothetical protein [unclassified Nocardioides]|uniref:hypothetical protein n=1 Tax=unclassified Nocardioides TaxID=2615069 RepID=UPI0000570F9A|nr:MULTISPECIES: hypothetical protein [unclassified Nocardioides]ABL84155.1 hypothetical protein Noca_4660 [Nocardioides sp. JS614]